MKKFANLLTLCFLALFSTDYVKADNNSTTSGSKLYADHCASCHGEKRMGKMGPALLPQNLARLRKKAATDVVTNGRVATQMPAFKTQLSQNDIKQIINFIYLKPKKMPNWTDADIKKSRKDRVDVTTLSDHPQFKADPWNIFLVVESGDHHVTMLDGDTFKVISRFKSHYALHGGPKFTRDGRFVFFASRDGWISKYDLYNMTYVAEVRAGINTRNIAISDDGKYVAVANYWPESLIILNGSDLSLIKSIPARALKGQSSRISAVYNARPRKSFVVALKDVAEIWEVPYSKDAEPQLTQLVHDYRKDSGELGDLKSGFLQPIHIKTDAILDDFFFSPDYREVIGAARPLDSGRKGKIKNGQVIQLDVRRKIADLDLPGMPHLGSGIVFNYKGHQVLATPSLREAEVDVIDMSNWKTIKKIKTDGPGFFMRSHENTPYAWSDVFFGPHKDEVHIIDKRTLKIIKTLKPEPGKTAAHIEFTKDGRYALLSIMEMDGAIIVYDAKTFKEVKRLPMKRPVGKYNVYNKTHLSLGTSH